MAIFRYDFYIMKKLWDLPLEKLVNIIIRHVAFWINIQPYLEIAIYVENQLKNDSYC